MFRMSHLTRSWPAQVPETPSPVPITFSGPWSDTTSTFQSMSLDDDDEVDEVRLGHGHMPLCRLLELHA